MPNNMILLETIALTQSAASVTFDNLPTSGYTDLKLVISGRSDKSAQTNYDVNISFNGTTYTLANRAVYGTGSVAGSLSEAAVTYRSTPGATATASTFGNAEIYIPNYRSANFKSISIDGVSENNATAAFSELIAGLVSTTAAITSITFTPLSSNYVAGSTFSLYGIAAFGTTPVLAPKATGGNIVANDGTYWYHAFTSSGNFVPQVGLTADCLVIAGGGGGGRSFGGGGGAGGLLAFTSQALANGTNYACTIGAGGANQGGSAFAGNNGNDSQFASLTLVKGGGGGGYDAGGGVGSNGKTGGSGGGGSRVGFGTGGAPTTGQGFRGGNQTGTGGTGGGGAGATGQDLSGSSGTGGNGSSAYSAWGIATNTGQNVSGTRWYAGGGGGQSGAGGNGGGGQNIDGQPSTVANGTANTGGGGGGDTVNSSGGSGIIVIRYSIN
jgi:hypothetical protein